MTFAKAVNKALCASIEMFSFDNRMKNSRCVSFCLSGRTPDIMTKINSIRYCSYTVMSSRENTNDSLAFAFTFLCNFSFKILRSYEQTCFRAHSCIAAVFSNCRSLPACDFSSANISKRTNLGFHLMSQPRNKLLFYGCDAIFHVIKLLKNCLKFAEIQFLRSLAVIEVFH